jgi:hypothetical protein
VGHSGRGRSALANGHDGDAPRGSVDSGLDGARPPERPPHGCEQVLHRADQRRAEDHVPAV